MHLSKCTAAIAAAGVAFLACNGDPEFGGQDQSSSSGWTLQRAEDFEKLSPIDGRWLPDDPDRPDDGPFADAGAYFKRLGVTPPVAFRASAPFGDGGWLTAESYTRSTNPSFGALATVVPDPAGGANKVLRVRSPEHTDGTVIRSTDPLPSRYRISLRVGYADFGDGRSIGLNGYDGNERAEPWSGGTATEQNGFYWLTILDAEPRPHNNTWIHHHRKVVIDSDNHHPPWMEIFNGREFVLSGEHPVMMFAVDGSKGAGDAHSGKPFLSWSQGKWQPSGAIRAVASYIPKEWYQVTIERFDTRFTLEVSGRFRLGDGNITHATYRATLDAAEKCVWHFNDRPTQEAAPHCVDESPIASQVPEFPSWPKTGAWPDWFMFGDPHTNFYEGEVFYDDVRLEVWSGP
jgi:hypothetical protein